MRKLLIVLMLGALVWASVAVEARWTQAGVAHFYQTERTLVRRVLGVLVDHQLRPHRPPTHRRLAANLFVWLWHTRTLEEQAIIDHYLHLRATDRAAILR